MTLFATSGVYTSLVATHWDMNHYAYLELRKGGSQTRIRVRLHFDITTSISGKDPLELELYLSWTKSTWYTAVC